MRGRRLLRNVWVDTPLSQRHIPNGILTTTLRKPREIAAHRSAFFGLVKVKIHPVTGHESTGFLKMIVGVLTTCHTHYT
jgi:hypothetical protein